MDGESSFVVFAYEEGVEVGVPHEGYFEDGWLELFIGDGSALEQGEESRSCLLEALCPFLLGARGEFFGWCEAEFSLSGRLFSVFSLCGCADGGLFFGGLFLDVSELDDAFWVSCGVHEVEVGAVVEWFEDAR